MKNCVGEKCNYFNKHSLINLMGMTEEYNADIRERSSWIVFNISHRMYTAGLCCFVLRISCLLLSLIY